MIIFILEAILRVSMFGFIKNAKKQNDFQLTIDEMRAENLAEIAVFVLKRLDGFAISYIEKTNPGFLKGIASRVELQKENK